MLDLAKHIVNQKAADFEPQKFEDHYEAALTEIINAKRNGKTIGPKPRPRGENVVDLMELKKSIAGKQKANKYKLCNNIKMVGRAGPGNLHRSISGVSA